MGINVATSGRSVGVPVPIALAIMAVLRPFVAWLLVTASSAGHCYWREVLSFPWNTNRKNVALGMSD